MAVEQTSTISWYLRIFSYLLMICGLFGLAVGGVVIYGALADGAAAATGLPLSALVLGVAAAVAERPDIILLDEPINALDEKGVQLIKALLLRERERGAIIIIACHDKEELEFLSNEIIEIEEGKLKGQYVLEKDGGQDE